MCAEIGWRAPELLELSEYTRPLALQVGPVYVLEGLLTCDLLLAPSCLTWRERSDAVQRLLSSGALQRAACCRPQ